MKLRPPTDPSRAKAVSPSPIYWFDRITLWIDRPELPISIASLKKHCRAVRVSTRQMRCNAQWKLKVSIFQPDVQCLILLAKAFGNDIRVILTYAEIVCDLLTHSKAKARRRRDEFLASARMRYQRQTVVRNKRAFYYGRRSDRDRRRPNVLVVYADRASKLNNAPRLSDETAPDLHVEWRGSGSSALAGFGLVTLEDLIEFDHLSFWRKNLRMYCLPKPTELGRLLARVSGASTDVTGSALRKRAANWKQKHSIDGRFIMHNALLATRDLTQYLETMSFPKWVRRALSR